MRLESARVAYKVLSYKFQVMDSKWEPTAKAARCEPALLSSAARVALSTFSIELLCWIHSFIIIITSTMLTSTLSKTTRMAGRQLLAKRAFSAAAEPKAHKASAHWKELAAKRPIDKDYEHVRTVMFCWKRNERMNYSRGSFGWHVLLNLI